MMDSGARCAALIVLSIALGGCTEQEPATDESGTDSLVAETGAPAAAGDAFLNPNEATREELVGAGLDSTQADALVAGRPYSTMTAVDSALALTEDERAQVYTRVWLPLDLNTASDAEILLIPGLGDRMLHEFKEYRPYRAIEQFRREIGKYVDEAEVARLERYVTIR
jgi:DNA uptake protein ComE-like DNA-binding protein